MITAESSTLFKPITTFIFDMDGVLTDGTVMLFENGLQARRMNIKDGYALQLAIRKGYRVIVVSGAVSETAAERLKKLGVTEINMSVTNKRKFIEDYAANKSLHKSEILFMGDDIPDWEAMAAVGLPTCPSDAVNEIKALAKYQSPLPGGMGCVRDVVEQVLKANDHWQHEEAVSSK
jgi:3-deoxy-D-manno-octulosonate 8-phosphate phosphatase (KDO 8-P phosphatase)